METNQIVTYLACLTILFIIGKVLAVPIKKILKLIGNSILGAILLYFINIIGQAFEFHIGINVITSIIVGILGVPGVILLIIVKLFIAWKWLMMVAKGELAKRGYTPKQFLTYFGMYPLFTNFIQLLQI